MKAPLSLLIIALLWPVSQGAAQQDTTAASGRFVMSGEELRRQNVDDPRMALTAAPGVTLRNLSPGVRQSVALRVRGSLTQRPAAYLDGAPLRTQLSGLTLPLPALGVASLSLTSGVAPVNVADAAGGVIDYASRRGGSALAFGVHAASDQPLGSGVGRGFSRFEAELSGPLTRRGGFFIGATLIGHASAYRGAGSGDETYYALGGIDTIVAWSSGGGPPALIDTIFRLTPVQGGNLPADWRSQATVHGRVDWQYAPGGRVALTAVLHGITERAYPGIHLLAPSLYSGAAIGSRLLIVNLEQALGAPGGRPLALRATLSVARDLLEAGTLTAASESATRAPALGFGFGGLEFAAGDTLTIDERFIRNLRYFVSPLVPYQGNTQYYNVRLPRIGPYGTHGFTTSGLQAPYQRFEERRLFGRWQLDWTVSGATRLAAGVDLEQTHVTAYEATLASVLDVNAFVESPRRLGVFAAGRLRFAGVAFDAGLRYDRYSGNGEYPVVPARIFSHPDWNWDTTAAGYAANLAALFSKAPARGYLSPRLRATFDVAAGTQATLGVAREFEPSTLYERFAFHNTDINISSSFAAYGRDVPFPQGTLIEAGLRHARRGWAVEAGLWTRDAGQYGARLISVYDPATMSTVIVPALDAFKLDVLGADAGILVNPGGRLEGRLSLTMARTTEAAGSRTETGAHAALQGRLAGFDALATLRTLSGERYTRSLNFGSGVVTPAIGQQLEPFNASKLPRITQLDLRLGRGFALGGRRLTAFADVRNLLDARNLIAVFGETGSDDNAQHRNAITAPLEATLRAEAGSFLQPDNSVLLPADCGAWPGGALPCVGLKRAEARFGDGDGVYSVAEQGRAFNAHYDALYPKSRFYLPGRTVRLGFEIR
jgi:hypothetical protein